jgi:hypothetical protein
MALQLKAQTVASRGFKMANIIVKMALHVNGQMVASFGI